MRQFLLAVPMLVALGTTAASAAPTTVGNTPCPDPTKALDTAKFQRLGELPPGDVFRAVYRPNEGCPAQFVEANDRLDTVPKKSYQKPKP